MIYIIKYKNHIRYDFSRDRTLSDVAYRMDNEVTFSLSYEALFSEAERLIRDIRAFSHLPIMQDDMTPE
ncbi:hypothetical protein ABI57_24385 [Salmonella enterica subsp. enterica serovar Veneziana]|nr:hypothetical protein ABI57_24385 [Salmonella enterica subsp. enterica serovar Veneziana]